MSNITLLTGDCTQLLSGVPTASVDSVVTDPPYPCIKRPYGTWTEAEWFALMDAVVPEVRRVLKPTGSAVFVLQPNSERLGRMRTWLWEFLAKWGREWGIVQDAWWWNNAAMPEAHSIQGRLMRPSVKACVWLGGYECYRNQDVVLWQESDHHVSEKASERFANDRKAYPSGHGASRARILSTASKRGGVTPFNLLPVPNQHQKNEAGSHGHGAGTPLAICAWWVRFITPTGGTVLDPFSGTATVGLAAKQHGCGYIGIERMPEYQAIAAKRLGVEIPTVDTAPEKVA